MLESIHREFGQWILRLSSIGSSWFKTLKYLDLRKADFNSWFQWEALYADQPWESCWATPKLLSNGEIQLLQHLESENFQKPDAVCKVVLCFLHMPFSSPFFFFFCFIDIKEGRQEEERRKLSLLPFYLSLVTSVNSWSHITDRWPSDGIISVWGNLTALEKSMQLFFRKSFDENFVFVVQSLSHVWLFGTPWTATHLVSLFFTISQSLLKFMSMERVVLSSHLNLCCPLLF